MVVEAAILLDDQPAASTLHVGEMMTVVMAARGGLRPPVSFRIMCDTLGQDNITVQTC